MTTKDNPEDYSFDPSLLSEEDQVGDYSFDPSLLADPDETPSSNPEDYSFDPSFLEGYEPVAPPKTKEDVIANEEDMETIRQGLTYMNGKRKTFLHKDFDEMDNSELFETWQNWQRWFKVGNPATTTRTGVKAFSGTDEEKRVLDKNFRLFEGMESGLKDDPVDTIRDYVWGAAADPITLVSLGVGKAFSFGGSKAASAAIKEGVKSAATSQVKKTVVKQGLQTVAVEGAKKALKYSAVDMTANVALDVLQQKTLMETGTQEEYSPLQTAVSLGLSAGIPVILGASSATRSASMSKWVKDTPFESSLPELMKKDLTKEGLVKEIKRVIPKPQAKTSVINIFEGLKGPEGMEIVQWGRVKDELPDWVVQGKSPKDREKVNLFMDQFLHGNKQSKGFVNFLVEEKVPFVKNLFADENGRGGTTSFIYNMIDLLDDETVTKMSKDFSDSFGSPVDGLPKSVEELKKFFATSSSYGGRDLGLFSESERLLVGREYLRQQKNVREVEKKLKNSSTLGGWSKFSLSAWKRLLTSHLSTTGANVSGFNHIYAMDTVTDVVLSALDLGSAGLKAALGDLDGAKNLFNRSMWTAGATARRATNVLNWDDTIEASERLLEVLPDAEKILNQVRSGDMGAGSALKLTGLDGNIVAKNVDKTVEFAQAISAVKIQDRITKNIAFYSAFEGALMRRRGVTLAQFLRDPDYAKNFADPKFTEEVVGYAVDRASRETVSKSYANYSKSAGPIQKFATGIENFSNNSVGGYVLPFGRFLNGTLAFAGDHSGLNLALHTTKKMAGKSTVDLSTKDGSELFANAVVGWTFLLGAHLPYAIERVENGRAWNEAPRGDGSQRDTTHDWPESVFRLTAQLWAHLKQDGEIPTELREEAAKVYLLNSTKDVDATLKTSLELLKSAYTLDFEGGGELATDLVKTVSSRYFSGLTRPLDQVNEPLKFIGGNGQIKDRRENWTANSFRYVDALFAEDLPNRNSAVYGELKQDLGKQVAGSRSAPESTLTSTVSAKLGIPSYKVVRWDGPPELKNRLDGLFHSLMEIELEAMYDTHDGYDELPYEDRYRYFQSAKKRAKDSARTILAESMQGGDRILQYYLEILKLDKDDTKRQLKEMGIEEDLFELAKDPSGWEQLETIMYLVERREEFRDMR